MVVGGQRHAPAAVSAGKTPYPLYSRLGGPQGRSGRVRKFSPALRFDPRTVQPVVGRYTEWAIPAKWGTINLAKFYSWGQIIPIPVLAIFGRLNIDFSESKCFLRGPETPVEMKE